MTILPRKKSSVNPEEKTDSSQQNENSDRKREDVSVLNEANSSNRRSQFSERQEHLKKRYKESDRTRDRKLERERKREVRREQRRDRIATTREISDDNNSPGVDSVDVEPTCNNNQEATVDKEDCTGFNSEDEYDEQGLLKEHNISSEEWQTRDAYFSRGMSNLGFEIKLMKDDGACLFRSIADQIYGDQEFHNQVRQDCMNYIVQNRDYFEPYVTEDFDKYVARKRIWNVHGNHLEIQAMSQLYNRTIEVYCYQITPINIFNGTRLTDAYQPIRLSYHRMCHYNSIGNPNSPSVEVGSLDIEQRKFKDAVRASEDLQIEQIMLEDKLKATDWEATNEAIEEQVARESYIQYFRDSEKRLRKHDHSGGSSSTVASATSPRSSRRDSCSPEGFQFPKESSKTTLSATHSSGTLPMSTCDPLGGENLFCKHSPIHVEQSTGSMDLTEFSAEEAGPSNRNSLGFEEF